MDMWRLQKLHNYDLAFASSIGECKAAATAVVNALRLDNFTPGCAENPKLQRHYAAIQAGGT